jgi:hypothetical protein
LEKVRDGREGVVEIAPNLFHVPRGFVLDMFGWKIGCCGGAESPNMNMLVKGRSWWPQERVDDSDWAPLVDAEIDFLVTHCPPAEAIKALFPPLRKEDWGLPRHWKDLSAESIQRLWEAKGRPKLYCGHFHRDRKYHGVHILDENQLVPIYPKGVSPEEVYESVFNRDGSQSRSTPCS